MLSSEHLFGYLEPKFLLTEPSLVYRRLKVFHSGQPNFIPDDMGLKSIRLFQEDGIFEPIPRKLMPI
jgi:hypothetical protein